MIDPNDAHRFLVNLTGVSTGQYLVITIPTIVDNTGNAAASVVSPQIGILVGDVDATGRTDGNDVSGVQTHTRQAADSGNFRFDGDTSGRIDGNDVSTTQSLTRTFLPSAP